MRLRRRATRDFEINDQNNGRRHEEAFTNIIRKKGILDERKLLQDSFGAVAPAGRARADPRAADRACAASRAARSRRRRRSSTRSSTGIENVQRIYDHAEEHHEELNLYIVGEGGERRRPRRSRRWARQPKEARMKVAYWPGCVSRGFTPELHGSMALVADRLGIELVELDRANCCGAGVIAEHNQELADTLNARTFAMAQKTGLAMMNICSTCQGAQSECQERLDADTGLPRSTSTRCCRPRASRYERGITNKNFLWLLVEDYGLDRLRELVMRPLTGLRVGPFYGCYVLRPTTPARLRRASRSATSTSSS